MIQTCLIADFSFRTRDTVETAHRLALFSSRVPGRQLSLQIDRGGCKNCQNYINVTGQRLNILQYSVSYTTKAKTLVNRSNLFGIKVPEDFVFIECQFFTFKCQTLNFTNILNFRTFVREPQPVHDVIYWKGIAILIK